MVLCGKKVDKEVCTARNAGKDWNLILKTDEHAEINEVHIDLEIQRFFMQRHINEEDMYLHTLEEELGLKFINQKMVERIGEN